MIRIGIICPSEIAFRRFLPALELCKEFEYIGVAVANSEEWYGEKAPADISKEQDSVLNAEFIKAQKFKDKYGGIIFESYSALINSPDVDAIYIPLPPALHYKWAKKALENGKHVLVEKPSTTNAKQTNELISIAKEKKLALHENYMFVFHKQLEEITNIISANELGDVRLYRIDFGFPKRPEGDFRYIGELGGGALLDCGGYTVKYASKLLGEDSYIKCADLNYVQEYDVDLYGSATLKNPNGEVAQVSFGMDNEYKCDLEVWGSKGRLLSGRVLTAPADLEPSCILKIGGNEKIIKLSSDNSFEKSILFFGECIKSEDIRMQEYRDMKKQAELVEMLREKANERN